MKGEFYIIGNSGEKTLSGKVVISGAKNDMVNAFAASLLMKGDLFVRNVPDVSDTEAMAALLSSLGGSVKRTATHEYKLNTGACAGSNLRGDIAKSIRASILYAGPLLARFGLVSFPFPGGCVIGKRPIDLFISGFMKMGARVSEKDGIFSIRAPRGGKIRGASIFFKRQSVTATETFMLAAVCADGTTVIKNAACEPEIAHLAEFLNSCGARIKGAGTSMIEIAGTGLLSAGKKIYDILPDRVEAGSFAILGALAARSLTIERCIPAHFEALIEALIEAGVDIKAGENTLVVRNSKRGRPFRAVDVKTHEYPGFATDLQAPMAVFLTQAEGEAIVFETIFEGRLGYVGELIRMGADILPLDQHRIQIKGGAELKGREVESPDLRAGLAYIIAAIVAKGDSVVHNAHYIDRGYERIEERLRAIGVKIERKP
ncbi:UDP-N-acetylglucosamine 1-carboxyvinyltransferase [bacterium]|nr:UDP-N-acetylglucosamine 1-carboxyvinyltransferase [bacterium]